MYVCYVCICIYGHIYVLCIKHINSDLLCFLGGIIKLFKLELYLLY